VTASKIILVLSLTLAIAAAGAALVLGTDPAAPSSAATAAVAGPEAGLTSLGTNPTPSSAPTAVGLPAFREAPASAEPTPPAPPDHGTPDDDPRPNPSDDGLNASVDFTPLGRPQNGRTNHNAADSFVANPSCSHQCITKGVAHLHGNDVEIVVETNVPAQIFISVTAVIDGEEEIWLDWTSFGHTSHTWLLEDLAPGVTYHVMATATDDNQYTSYAWGEFTLP
jgi:hypothetical protein